MLGSVDNLFLSRNHQQTLLRTHNLFELIQSIYVYVEKTGHVLS